MVSAGVKQSVENAASKQQPESEYILEFRNISKYFPGVMALKDINFGIKHGTTHVLVGENGAGKSTLMKVINGIYKADTGEILLDGKPYTGNGPVDALKAGISMIYQELNIIPEMTVLDNMYLGREIVKNGSFLDRKAMFEKARAYLDQQGLHDYDLNRKMKDLSVAEAQMIEIVKAISANARVILMDEPTSSLTEKEVDYLFNKIAELKKVGISIIFISHKMDEIYRIADYITVLRDGEHIATVPAKDTNIPGIIEMMVGRKINEVYPKKTNPIGEEIFCVKGLSQPGVFQDVNISLRKGEILGFSGLIGAGRTQIARAIMGMDPYESGEIYLEGNKLDIRDVNDAIKAGLSYMPEDRRRQGLVLVASIAENIGLVAHKHIFHSPWVNKRGIAQLVDRMFKLMSIKAPSSATKVETLSGGNQQKVVLGKWLSTEPKVLLLDEPTRGIDVGTKYEIYKLMLQMCEKGVSIMLFDSDLEELLGMSDRIMVVYQGKIVKELDKSEATAQSVMKYAVGGSSNG